MTYGDTQGMFEIWKQQQKKIGELRSGYIEQTIQIESRLDDILESLVTPVTGNELITQIRLVKAVILQDTSVTFEMKIRFLQRILKISGKNEWLALAPRLRKVGQRRNMLAHWESSCVDISENPESIAFSNMKSDGSFERVSVDPAIIDDWHKHAYQLENDLFDLYADLNPWLSATASE
jgi:hypothetical protein